MSVIEGVLSNRAITLPILSWFAAQLYKFLHYLFVNRKIDFRKFVSSGGMPSSHSAISVCLATVLGIQNGFDSGLFAMAVIFAFVVMTDAAGVRRAAGKQAEVLNKLIHSTGHIRIEKNLRELIGHTPVEVIVGAALGLAMGILFA